MTLRSLRHTPLTLSLAVFLASLFSVAELQAQQPKQKRLSKTPPFLVCCAASVERLLDDADYIFEIAERPELSEVIGGELSAVRDLKGLNRDSSVGLLVFLDGLIPEPVGFVPVKDIDEMLATVSKGPVTTNKKQDGLIEILGGNQTLFARVVGDYAFIGRTESALAREFSDPAQHTQRLAASYDFAASLNLKAIPKPTRDLILGLFRAGVEVQLQQRDGEPDASFRLRQAAARANLELAEMLGTQAEEITVGFNVSAEEKNAYAEMVMTADPKTELAKYLNELGGAHCQFASMLDSPAHMTIGVCLKFDKVARNYLQEWISIVSGKTIQGFRKKNPKATEAEVGPIGDLFHSLDATLKQGKLDLVLQLRGAHPGPYTLVGGMRLAHTDRFNTGVAEILKRMTPTKEVQLVEASAAVYREVIVHKLKYGKNRVPEGAAARLFGKDYCWLLGAGNGSVWIALGGDESLPILKTAIDHVLDAPINDNPVAPVQIALHLATLVDLLDEPDGTANPLADVLRESFANGGGTIRAELQPRAHGAKVRVTFDEGYIKLVGKLMAKQIDERRK